MRVDDLAFRQGLAQRGIGVGGQERGLDPDAPDARTEPADVLDRELDRVDRAGGRGLDRRRPELAELVLERLEPIADVGGLFRPAAPIDQHRQITAHADGVHVIEEEEAVAAEQILHVVLRRDEKRVDAGVLQKLVEPGGIERDGPCGRLCRAGKRCAIHDVFSEFRSDA